MITKTENSSFRDSMVQKLLASRKDISPDYTQSVFEKEFQAFFKIIRSKQVGDSNRTLYLMKNESHAWQKNSDTPPLHPGCLSNPVLLQPKQEWDIVFWNTNADGNITYCHTFTAIIFEIYI